MQSLATEHVCEGIEGEVELVIFFFFCFLPGIPVRAPLGLDKAFCQPFNQAKASIIINGRADY